MDQHQELKVALPPYDVNSEQQYPQRYSRDNGEQSPQAYNQHHQGYSRPPGYQPVPQNYIEPSAIVMPGPPVSLQEGHHVGRQERPPDYCIPAILACLCCFWPTGICAIIAANNASQAADAGDMTYAKQQSKTARTLVIVTIILGIVCVSVGVILRLQ